MEKSSWKKSPFLLGKSGSGWKSKTANWRRALGLPMDYWGYVFTNNQTSFEYPTFVLLFLGFYLVQVATGYTLNLFNNGSTRKRYFDQKVQDISTISELTCADGSPQFSIIDNLTCWGYGGWNSAISENVKKAVIATEDENFMSHKGGLRLFAQATLGSVVGVVLLVVVSTNTQQVIKQQGVGDAPLIVKQQ